MSKVIDIGAREGEVRFMQCQCDPEKGLYTPVVLVQDPPLIVSLVCVNCESEVQVENGLLKGRGGSE